MSDLTGSWLSPALARLLSDEELRAGASGRERLREHFDPSAGEQARSHEAVLAELQVIREVQAERAAAPSTSPEIGSR